METPSSTRRVTRSQILANSNSNIKANNIPMSRKTEGSEKGMISKSRPGTGNQDRSALIDISNDSPIVGVAIGSFTETPLSKKRNNNQAKDHTKTPGSGEALLRGQVKTLLQKVEEEAELSKLALEHKPFSHLKGCFIDSPTGLLAPTPANTPPFLNLYDNEDFKNSCLALVTPSPVQENLMISQVVTGMLEGTEQGPICENSSITRSLLLDFSEKSEGSDSSGYSVLTNIGGESEGKEEKSSIMEEDDASVWPVQVNASFKDDDEEEEEDEDEDEDGIEELEENEDDDYAVEEKERENGGFVDELCEWMSNISVCEGKLIPKFSGKHTRFVYNSDDEIEGEEEIAGGNSDASFCASTGIVRLKGLPALPTPEGKHVRFAKEMEEEEDN